MPQLPPRDPEFSAFAAQAALLGPRYAPADDDPWSGSPFEWILRLPSRSKGAVAEALVAEWAENEGLEVRRSSNSEADRIIEGHRVEIKMSTLWKSGGFKFQQIREQAYDYCLCLGILPHDTRAWLIPKSVLQAHVIGHMGQHTGSGGSETAWLGFQDGHEYDWMEPYGDTLADVLHIFRNLGRGSY